MLYLCNKACIIPMSTHNNTTNTINTRDNNTMTKQKPTARNSIRTRYSGASSSITATCNGQRVRVGYDHALDATSNHAAAAQAFLNRHNEFETELVTDALSFDHDYFWTWDITGPRKEAA
jgi:hypothetical protein